MSRKKTEINPIRAERLKILIDDLGISQSAFAEKVHYSQQHISGIINLKTALTEETAQDIVAMFPKYQIGWLLGYTDAMTISEEFLKAISEAGEEAQLLFTGFLNFAHLSGFKVKVSPVSNELSIEDNIQNIKSYCTIERDDKSITLGMQELIDFENELCDYVELRLRHMMK